MDRVFLDANVLFSAAYRRGAGLTRLWKLKEVTLITSEYAAQEARLNLSEAAQRKRLDELLSSMHVVATPPSRPLPRGIALPDKDAPIFLAALEGSSQPFTYRRQTALREIFRPQNWQYFDFASGGVSAIGVGSERLDCYAQTI